MISREDFERILEIETRARDHYNAMLTDLTDPEICRRITEIRDDEVRHMALAKRLLELIKG